MIDKIKAFFLKLFGKKPSEPKTPPEIYILTEQGQKIYTENREALIIK
jgi:hypothetical protein